MEKKLIVDLDKSLIKIDLFSELLCIAIINNPIIFLKTLFFLCKSKAYAKKFLSENIIIDLKNIPYNQSVVELINEYLVLIHLVLLGKH